MIKMLSAVIMTVLFFKPDAQACSIACFNKLGLSQTAYSMEWPGDIKPDSADLQMDRFEGGGFFMLPAGLKKRSILGSLRAEENSLVWKSKYKSLVLSVFGPDMPFNGVNEKGLEVYVLGSPTRVIDTNLKATARISEMDILPLLLDTAKDNSEAVKVLKKVQIEHLLFPLHIFIKDASGEVLLIDYQNGMRIYKPNASSNEAVLTNSWYATSIEEYKTETTIDGDLRHTYLMKQIAKGLKKGVELDALLNQTGNSYTIWKSTSLRTNKSWDFKVTVKPHSPQGKKTFYNLDLQKLFSSKKPNFKIQHLLFSNLVFEKAASFTELTDDVNRSVQDANFKIVKENQEMLLGRNGNKVRYSVGILNHILAQIKKAPLSSSMDRCHNLLN